MKNRETEGLCIDQTVGVPLRSGNYLYWDAQFQQIVQADLGRFCPEVSYSPAPNGGFSAKFRQNALGTRELCRDSVPISDPRARIPEDELEGFIHALDELHQKAKERNVVGDSARFIREFSIPDPREMPEAWRVSSDRPGHLLVLWGFEGRPASTVLPLTETSKAWPNAERRVDLRDALKSALAKRTGKHRSSQGWWWLVLLLLVAALAWLVRACDLRPAPVAPIGPDCPTGPDVPVDFDLVADSVAPVDSDFPTEPVDSTIPDIPVNPDCPDSAPMDQECLDRRLEEENASRGSITISMGWTTGDDLDLHVIPPSGPDNEIFHHKRVAGGGTLDVDANAESVLLLENPVENVFFSEPEPGRYQIFVKNFKDRTPGESTKYLVRVTIDGESRNFEKTIDGDKTLHEVWSFDYPPNEKR